MKFNWFIVDRIVGLLLVVVAIFSLIKSFQTSQDVTTSNRQLTAYVKCQTDWTTFLHKAITIRSDTSAQATQAMDDLITSVLEAKSSEDVKIALEKYKAARQLQIDSRTQNPLPPPPNDVCKLKE